MIKNPMDNTRFSISIKEQYILGEVGLAHERNAWIYDVKIHKNGVPRSIHTIEVGRGHPETVVLIHGYLGAAVYFFKLLAQLEKHVHVDAIDLLGAGLFYRPNVEFKSYDQSVAFFADAIEDWRKKLKI